MKKAKRAKKTKGEAGENTGKKGGKKKLLLIPIALVLVAAVAAAVVLFVLPHFGINLVGGDGDSSGLGEALPKKGVEAYTVGEDTTVALDTILEEGEGELIALRSPGKPTGDESSDMNMKYTYIYELTNPAEVMGRYLDTLLGGEEGFSLTDETYLVIEDRPELADEEGTLILARTSAEEGRVFQLVIGWSQASANLAVRVSTAPGKITKPEPEKEPEPSSVSEQLENLRSMTPAQLGLPGSSMDTYTIFPVDGFVKVDNVECRRFNIYDSENPGSIAGTYLLSTDQQHLYVLDPATNTVSTIR